MTEAITAILHCAEPYHRTLEVDVSRQNILGHTRYLKACVQHALAKIKGIHAIHYAVTDQCHEEKKPWPHQSRTVGGLALISAAACMLKR